MSAPTLADGVLAIVRAACDPLHERIKMLEQRLADIEAPKAADAEALRARTAALRKGTS